MKLLRFFVASACVVCVGFVRTCDQEYSDENDKEDTENDLRVWRLNRLAEFTDENDEDEEDDEQGATGVTQLPPCDEDKLMGYLSQLQAINPESIVNLATMDDTDALCRKVTLEMDNMNYYLQTCEPPQQKDLYMQLIEGVKSLHRTMCLDDKFKATFSKHSACYMQLHNEYEDCTGPADWTENSNPKEICRLCLKLEPPSTIASSTIASSTSKESITGTSEHVSDSGKPPSLDIVSLASLSLSPAKSSSGSLRLAIGTGAMGSGKFLSGHRKCRSLDAKLRRYGLQHLIHLNERPC